MLHSLLGLNNLEEDFGYTPATTQYDQSSYVDQSASNLNRYAGQVGQYGTDLMSQSQALFSGDSPYLKAARQKMQGDVGDQTQAQMQNISAMMAQRGAGGGGMSSLLKQATSRGAGETLAQGNVSLLGQGAQMGQAMMGTAMQAFGQQGQAYGQVGDMGMGLTKISADVGLDASARSDAANQYEMTSSYNQQLGNRQNRAGFASNLIGSAAGAFMMSDENVKEDIVKVDVSDDGYNIYEFKYIGDDTKYRGVIAQEILEKKPEAVLTLHNGILGVDYSQLDVNFTIA
jgi:hypothetical protein